MCIAACHVQTAGSDYTLLTVVLRLVRWDMRAPEGVVQEMSSPSVVQWAGGHDYKTNVAFNCMATSGQHTCALSDLKQTSAVDVTICSTLIVCHAMPVLTEPVRAD